MLFTIGSNEANTASRFALWCVRLWSTVMDDGELAMKAERLTEEQTASIQKAGVKKLSILASWLDNQLTCSHCRKCTRRCDILEGPGLDMGQIIAAYRTITQRPYDEQPQAVLELAQKDPTLYHTLRRCCFCGHCTAACARHIAAPDQMRAWRELFMRANLMPPDDSKLVMVDNEWHIFSAYRAIYQISYPDALMLDAAAEAGPGHVDTLLFPGCSLVSYAPHVVQALGTWLSEAGVRWALSDACCGSPLMSAGMFERAHDLRASVIERMQRAGISRMVTICPGCADEFRPDMPAGIELVPLPELLLACSEERMRKTGESGFSPVGIPSVTFFDSCHDRGDVRNANALRKLFALYLPDTHQLEMDHARKGTLCCGAGGAVSSYDADITNERVWRVIEEASATQAHTLITMCPTCTYTIAQALLSDPNDHIEQMHYLEALLGVWIDWVHIFAQLNDMWTGEYGPWLAQTFF